MSSTLKFDPALRELDTRQSVTNPQRTTAQTEPSAGFSELLRAKQGIALAQGSTPADRLKFSAHAQTRLQSRRISLEGGRMERLESAVRQAAGKGSKDALVLMDELAMVVSVKNRTVVTVVDRDNLKQNVFTNIDSAVIA